MKINHIGVAVRDIKSTCEEYEKLGFQKKGEIFCDESRKIRVQYIRKGEICLELVSPLHEGEVSPVDRFIGKGQSHTMYHICYEVPDICLAIEELKRSGYFLMEEPRTSAAMNDCKTTYLFHKMMGLIELVEC